MFACRPLRWRLAVTAVSIVLPASGTSPPAPHPVFLIEPARCNLTRQAPRASTSSHACCHRRCRRVDEAPALPSKAGVVTGSQQTVELDESRSRRLGCQTTALAETKQQSWCGDGVSHTRSTARLRVVLVLAVVADGGDVTAG